MMAYYGISTLKVIGEQKEKAIKEFNNKYTDVLRKFLIYNKLDGDVIQLKTGVRGRIEVVTGGRGSHYVFTKYTKKGVLALSSVKIWEFENISECYKGTSEMTIEDWKKIK